MKSSKLIEEQYKALSKEPYFNLGITVGLVDKNNIYEWKFTMLGPFDTPYKGGLFNLKIKFPKDFPLHAPSINFMNPIYHVNVNSDPEAGPLGFVGFDTLYNWKKETGIREILIKLYALFYWPNPDSSFCINKANEFKNDYSLYEAKIKYYCQKYAHPLKILPNYTALDWKFNDLIYDFKTQYIKERVSSIFSLLKNTGNFKGLINIKEYNKEKNDEKKLYYLRKQILNYFNTSLDMDLTGEENEIDLSNKNIGDNELNLFSEIEFNKLEEINLSHNKITRLFPLINFNKLKNIDLSYNKIENDSCGLSELLESNKYLKKINLNKNNLKIGYKIRNALSNIKKEIYIINQDINIKNEKLFEKDIEKVLITIRFCINGKSKIFLECYDNELVKDVLKKVCTKSDLKYTKILILIHNRNINLNLSLRQEQINKNGLEVEIITDVIFA